jgi:sortase A
LYGFASLAIDYGRPMATAGGNQQRRRDGRSTRRGRPFLAMVAVLGAFVSTLSVAAGPSAAAERPEGVRPGPHRLAANHPGQASGREVGFLQITKIGLAETVRYGIAMEVIDKGPAQWAGTSAPGGPGNVVLAGHRTTKTRPFYHLDRLDPGDAILMGDGTAFPALYRVTETFVVDPHDVWITYDTGDPVITLFACHPRGSARHRIVVRGVLREGLDVQ